MSANHATNGSNEIVITRVYDAPVERVWAAWVEPEQVAQWWGPRGFTITSHHKDVRMGGSWSYTMHGPDGVNYENKTVFLEVEEHAKMVYDHGGNDDRPTLFRVHVTFAEADGKTTMHMRMALPTAEAAVETRGFIKAANGNSTWDRLAEYLDKTRYGKERFVINRSFDASVERLFEVWTNPAQFSQWLAPTGMTMEFLHTEVRPGGHSFYKMFGGDVAMYGTVRYLELTRPTRAVYTQEFSNADGSIARHPMAPTWPASMLTVVEFAAEGPEQTRVTVTWEADGESTPEELATFVAGRTGMTGGWTGSFDKLESHLRA